MVSAVCSFAMLCSEGKLRGRSLLLLQMMVESRTTTALLVVIVASTCGDTATPACDGPSFSAGALGLQVRRMSAPPVTCKNLRTVRRCPASEPATRDAMLNAIQPPPDGNGGLVHVQCYCYGGKRKTDRLSKNRFV
jgi:hypothetical protein